MKGISKLAIIAWCSDRPTLLTDAHINFNLRLSPFSAVISLKKSLVKDTCGTPLLPSETGKLYGDSFDSLVKQSKILEEEIREMLKMKVE